MLLAVVLLAIGGVLASACGSDDDISSGNAGAAASETELVAIGDDVDIRASTRAGAVYAYDEFVAAGWKQHQIYDVETLPDATEARYGFYNRRDIEIRLYPDNALAHTSGAASAEEALARRVHDGSGFASRRVYRGYLVAGNAVMLCEVQVPDCVALIEAVEEMAAQ